MTCTILQSPTVSGEVFHNSGWLPLQNSAPSRSHRLPHREPSANCVMRSFKLLFRGIPETTPPPNNSGCCHCSCLQEFDGKTLWLKTTPTLVTGHGEIKLVLARKLPSLLDVSTGRCYVGCCGEKSHQQIYPTVNLALLISVPSMGLPPLKQSLYMQCQADFTEKNILYHLICNWNFLFLCLE